MKGILRILLLLLIVGAVALGACSLITGGLARPQPRPPGADGSARWAYDVALPRARSELATDAVLVEIFGEDVMPDGRLAANRGEWTLHFSSFTAAQRIDISVDHLKDVTIGSTTSPGVIRALGSPPGTFPDSIAIFASTAGHGASGTRRVVNPVECKYDSIAGTHVWAIKFRVDSTNETHRVRWDGIWLEVR